jgi:3-dehydroquinate synthase
VSENLFEQVDYRRKVDFGHTLSPYIEVASEHEVLHGEAVAMDAALSSQIAHDLGLLDAADLDRILSLLSGLGLSLVWAPMQVDVMWSTLSTVNEHRNGDLHLVVPTGIGSCAYLGLDAVTPQVLKDAHERLLLRPTRPPRLASDDAASR